MGCSDSKSTSVESSNKPTSQPAQSGGADKQRKIVLHYFNIRGRAEPIRLMLHYGGVPFEDKTINFEQWGEKKKNNEYRGPLDQLPFVEIDDEIICETVALVRLAAHKVGICGENDWEKAKADSLVDSDLDMIPKFTAVYFAKEDEKEEKMKELMTIIVPEYLGKLEKTLIANNGGDCFFVGKKITHADFQIFHRLNILSNNAKKHGKDDVLDSFPKLKGHYCRMMELPQLQDYLKSRPESDM